ncbi:MAG: SWIM zinc finger family protein [Filifactor alocis]|nr:SWIM zinc finger family protein [Filifactor alocis]
MRGFNNSSVLCKDNMMLALAPALTPAGLDEHPQFFCGDIVDPPVVSRSLLVLADIVSTRYFNYVPTGLRDPVLSAQGDRLRAECFSACNGVYARLDLFQEALYGEIAFGTTNVDIGIDLRRSLTEIKRGDKLKLHIGEGGMRSFHTQEDVTKFVVQRAVEMPDRWIRALGNCAGIHKEMKKVFRVEGMSAKNFIVSLPPASGKERSGWLTYSKTGIKLMPRKGKDSVYVSGLHRLSALKRLMVDIRSIDFYTREDREQEGMMVVVGLPGANLILSLTPKAYEGYSGEGSLLESLSSVEVIDQADEVSSILRFEPGIDERRLSCILGLPPSEVDGVLALLATYGKLGYDVEEGAYFHRELPEEPDRVFKDNPRLLGARRLLESTRQIGRDKWAVCSKDMEYRVVYDVSKSLNDAKCTCAWYLKYKNSRGPCKHILAVKMKSEHFYTKEQEK